MYIGCSVLLLNAKLTVKAARAPSATNNTMSFKFIYQQLGMPTASIFLILSLSCATNDLSNIFAEAQSSVTTPQDGQNATEEAIETFYIDGAIGSLVSDLLNSTIIREENVTGSQPPPIYVLAGNWSMGVVNGEVNYLQVDFIMGLQNGTQMQVYSVENLENIVVVVPSTTQNAGSTTPDQASSSSSNNLLLSSTNNYSLSLFGYVDVLTDDTVEWQNVPVSINIFNGNTISILLYPSETDNRFKGQPIYGIVTDILDANNEPIKPSIWAAADT
jgi:hypothetical protein